MPRKSASQPEPRYVVFDPTPEIFATDAGGAFTFALASEGEDHLETGTFDELRFVFSVWHPSSGRSIDLDRAYVELRGRFSPHESHWIKLAEIEPVIPAYASGESFDGWIVLPVMGPGAAFALFGSGFEPRARLQVRAHVYLVA